MAKQWPILFLITLLATAGCQNCGQAAREAEEDASMAAEEAQAAEQATEQAASEAAEQAASEAAEREAAERAAREAAERAAAEAARRHIVVPGDCLWCIAEDRWGDGVRWTEIYEANRDQIKDPDLIYPDQIFNIPQGG